MSKLAICFSGQGSQYVGMGLDYIKARDDLRELVGKLKDLTHIDFMKSFETEADYQKTSLVQPMIVLKSILGLKALDMKKYQVDAYFGFSLGEMTAYYASGIYALSDVMNLAKMRGDYMQQSCDQVDGSMAAIIGLDIYQVKQTIAPLRLQGVIDVANYNGYRQYVISGETKLIDQAIVLLKQVGARRAVKLKVNGAFHTKLMADASKLLATYIKTIEKNALKVPMLMNKDATWLKDEDVFNHLTAQITSPVKFIQMIETLKNEGFTHVLEIGPGRVLTGLIKKIDKQLEVANFDQYEQLEDVERWLEIHGFKK